MSGERSEPVVPAPRITSWQLVDRLLGIIGRGHSDHSSVELSRNTRGTVQPTVTVRTGEKDADTIEQAAAKAQTIFDLLCERYPFPEENGGGGDASPARQAAAIAANMSKSKGVS